MYKMVIADDEYLVRLGIKETIDWNNYNIEIVGEATNGKQCLELAKQTKPDIILSDIRMPLMDGLELVKAVNNEQLDTIIVMLSGYKDFEYAKESLENGAFQYLLKPIDNNQLVESVLKALQELENRRLTTNKIKQLDSDIENIKRITIKNILQGNIEVNQILEKIQIYNLIIKEKGIIICIQSDDLDDAKNKFSILSKSVDSVFTNCSFERLAFSTYIVYIIDIEKETAVKLLKDFIIDYESYSKYTLSIGISDTYNDLKDISTCYQQAKKNSKNKIFQTINTITTNETCHSDYHKTTIDTLAYIENNYKDNISIKDVSDLLSVSESHIMHVIKDDTNKTFNELLTEYRIECAKKLLSKGIYKIYTVSDMVGYNDTKYFSQVFKKITKVSPVEYIGRKKNE